MSQPYPLTSRKEQRMEAENEEESVELGFIPSAVSEPRCALQCAKTRVEKKRLQILLTFGICHRRRWCSPYVKCVRKVSKREAIEARRRRGVGFNVEGAGPAEGFSREAMGSIWQGTTRAQNVGTFHHQKSLGQSSLGRRRKCLAKLNRWQVATRDAVQGGAQHGPALRRCATAPRILCGEGRRLGSFVIRNVGKRQTQHVGKCEGGRMLQ